MKTKYYILIILFQTVFIVGLIINHFRLYEELDNTLIREQLLESDSKILIQLIQLKEYHYNDFYQIKDEDYVMYRLIFPNPQINPIQINYYTFSFSNDSILLYILPR